MSLVLIQESAKEVRRLSIAGSALAVGDFRLKKLIDPLEKAGEKVPVFSQVAKAIHQLVTGKQAEAAVHLLQLSTLLNAILYTQGQSGTQAALQDLEFSPSGWASTKTPARVLKPLVTALSAKGSGRFEVVKSAVERGAFNDLRLIEPALRALDDGFPELADLIADQVLPGYGPGILPRVRQGFELKGKRGDARRLRIMHRLDPPGSRELCQTALDDGSPEVKIAAIACLGSHEECLPLLVEQSKAKNKAIRAAALEAVAAYDRPEITAVFLKMIQGKTEDFVPESLRKVRTQAVLEALLAEARKVFAQLLQEKDATAPLLRFSRLLHALGGRADAASEDFLIACFGQAGRLAKVQGKNSLIDGGDISRDLAHTLYELGSVKALKALAEQHETAPPDAFHYVLHSALRTWAPDKVFAQFSPLLAQKKGATKEKAELIERAAWTAVHEGIEWWDEPDSASANEKLRQVAWDPRWLDAAIQADRAVMVCSLARPKHPGAVDYLCKLLDGKKKPASSSGASPGMAMAALGRCAYAGLTDLFVDLVTRKLKNIKSTHHYDYELPELFENVRHLPFAALPRLEALAAQVDDDYVDPLLVAIEALRQANKKPEA